MSAVFVPSQGRIRITVAGIGYVGLSNAIMLAQHNKVTAYDIDRQRIDRLNGPFFATTELLGKEVTRAVGTGQPIEQAHVGAPAVIHGGDLVRIYARKGALNISTQGLARTDGRPGETIQVKNITSNKLIHCRVDGPGTVSVEF